MIIRVAFAFMVLVMLLPHEPNLGLPQQPFAQILSAIRDTVTTRAARAVGELRQYDAAGLRPLNAERSGRH